MSDWIPPADLADANAMWILKLSFVVPVECGSKKTTEDFDN